MSIAGDFIAVGASRDDDLGIEAGAVYVFKRTGGVFSQDAKVTAHVNGDSGDKFGAAVAIDTSVPADSTSGDPVTTLVVGAPGDEVADPPNPTQFGAGTIYIFERSADGTAWNANAQLAASDFDASAEFGAAVAIDGDGIVVGAPEMDGGLAGIFGKAYFFQRRNITNNWSEDCNFVSSNPHGGDRFGNSVGIEARAPVGYDMVVGVPNDDDGVVPFDTGAAFVYTGAVCSWAETILFSSHKEATAKFGDAVDINDGLIAVGEPQADDNGGDNGAVHVFRLDLLGMNWEHTGRLLAGNPGTTERLGDRVGISGTTVIGGAPGEDAPGQQSIGAALVFDLMQGIFADGFESGDVSAWSTVVP